MFEAELVNNEAQRREYQKWLEEVSKSEGGVRMLSVEPTPPPPPTPPKPPDDYKDRIARYIPSEVVTLYLALLAAVAQAKDNQASVTWLASALGPDWEFRMNLAAFILGLLGTPLYLWFVLGVRSVAQIFFCMISFVMWALAIPDGLFKTFPAVIRGFLLPIYTFVVALKK